MSGPDNKSNTPDDRDLEDFLAGRGAVRDAYRAAAQEKSPVSVDDAILKMAAQAGAEPAAPVVKPRLLRRWPASLAAAAVLVLSLSVFVEIHQDPVAEKAVLAPQIAMDASPAPAAASAELQQRQTIQEMQRREASAAQEQEAARRRQSELKKEMSRADAASGSIPMPPPAELKMSADKALQPIQEAESSVFAKAEPEARGDVLSDEQKPAAPAPMMSAHSLRAAPADRMAAAAPAPVEEMSNASAFDQQIDYWLRTCAADSGPTLLATDSRGKFKATQQWRGLPVTGFVDGALQFAPTVSREAVVAQLNQMGPDAAACLIPASSNHLQQLRCGCLKP